MMDANLNIDFMGHFGYALAITCFLRFFFITIRVYFDFYPLGRGWGATHNAILSTSISNHENMFLRRMIGIPQETRVPYDVLPIRQ